MVCLTSLKFFISLWVIISCKNHWCTLIWANTQEWLSSTEKLQSPLCSSPRKTLNCWKIYSISWGKSSRNEYLDWKYFYVFHTLLKGFFAIVQGFQFKRSACFKLEEKVPLFFLPFLLWEEGSIKKQQKNKVRYFWESTPCFFCSMLYYCLVNEGKAVDVYLDFSKAFDSVTPSILL